MQFKIDLRYDTLIFSECVAYFPHVQIIQLANKLIVNCQDVFLVHICSMI